MSHTLTDADVFAPVVVPDGIDPRNDAAGDVERCAQALADRTHHLDLHAAKVDTPNAFEGDQSIDGSLTVTADASIGDVLTAREVHVLDNATVDDLLTTRQLKVTGTGVSTTIDHDAKVSGALTVTGNVTLSTGSLVISAGSATVEAALRVKANAQIDDFMAVAGSVDPLDEPVTGYKYISPVPQRITNIPLSFIQPSYTSSTGNATLDMFCRRASPSGPFRVGVNAQVFIPLKMPAHAVLRSFEVMYEKATSANVILYFTRRFTPDASWDAATAIACTAELVSSGNANGLSLNVPHKVLVTLAATIVDVESDYEIEILGNAGDLVHAMRVWWDDPGPRNH